MSRRVLLVLPTGTYRANAFLVAARRLGLEVVVASEEPSTLGPRRPGSEIVVDFDRPEESPLALSRLGPAGQVHAVVPVDETGVMVASHLAKALGLPGNPPEAARATRDKARLRALLHGATVPQPEWAVWTDGVPPRWDRYPAVVKPVDQAASRGVIRVDTPRELGPTGARVRSLLARDARCGAAVTGQPPSLLIESFVPGPEVAAEALTRDGVLVPLAIFDKPEPLDGPYFEETIYTTPTELTERAAARVWRTLQAAVTALGLGTGALHAEFRLGQGPPRLIDLASRPIGGRCSSVLQFKSGATLEELILRNALHDPFPDLEVQEGGFGVMMLPVPRAGRLLRVTGRNEAMALDGIRDLEITIPVGGLVEPPPDGDRYLGFMFSQGEDGPAAAQALLVAHGLLEVEIEEEV